MDAPLGLEICGPLRPPGARREGLGFLNPDMVVTEMNEAREHACEATSSQDVIRRLSVCVVYALHDEELTI